MSEKESPAYWIRIAEVAPGHGLVDYCRARSDRSDRSNRSLILRAELATC
jgi:hypothetical protein